MRLGVLLADNLNPEHAAVDGDYDVLYRRLFAAPDVVVECHSTHRGELPASVNQVDAWAIGGSRRSVYDDEPWLHELRRFVREAYDAGVTLVGICFGHQLVADVLGGTAGPAPVGWSIGATTYARPDGSTFELLASHRDQVLELPPGAERTLRSERCPIAGFRIGSQVITVQPHPEFSGALGAALYDGRRGVLGDDVVDRAIATCGHDLARAEVAGELLDFVRAGLGGTNATPGAVPVSGS